MNNVTVIDHPQAQHKLSLMRRRETPSNRFRELALEVRTMETPLAEMRSAFLSG